VEDAGDPAHLVEEAANGSSSARADLLELAALSRSSRSGELDLMLDDLAVRAGRGNDIALELCLELVHRLRLARPAITALIMDTAMVDDVAQAALMTVERRIGSYERRAKFRTWLHAVARNEALMALRRRHAEPVREEDIPQAPTRFSSMVAGRQTIKAIIDALPDPYRETLTLQVYEDLDYDAIAARLDVPVGTIRSRLAKARELLRSSLVT